LQVTPLPLKCGNPITHQPQQIFTITVTDAAAGQITMSMNSANTANVTPGRYVYDVLITSGASV
jgi:hypothetical protein